MLRYEHCTLCPRRCGVDRTAGQTGFCGLPGRVRVARAAPHLWEEPPLVTGAGSGAVFFSGCTLRCGFCQNAEISHGGFGRELDARQLRGVFERLIDRGCSNLNLVTPTQFLPEIVQALSPKLPVPVVYNCGGYESVETLRALEGLVDVWLPDFKYADSALARRLSGAADYPAVARAAIREMLRQTGAPVFQDGALVKGVLVRHLILPGQIDNSLGVLDELAALPKGSFLLSLMRQYTPAGDCVSMPPFNRRVTDLEYDAVLSWALLLGLDLGYTQEKSSAEAGFVPDFDLTGVDKPDGMC